MPDADPDRSRPSVNPGLCGACRNAREVSSSRGSVFVLCELSAIDARFPRYPPLPVRACGGYVPREQTG